MADFLDDIFTSVAEEREKTSATKSLIKEINDSFADNVIIAEDWYNYLLVISDTNTFFSEEPEHIDKIKPDLEYLLDVFNLADYIKVDYYVTEDRYNEEKTNARIYKRDFVEIKLMPNSLTKQMNINLYWGMSFITAKLRLKKNLRQFIRFCSALDSCFLAPKTDRYKKFDVYLFRNVDGDWKIINKSGYDCRRARKIRSAKSYTKDLENDILFLYKDTFYPEKKDDVYFTRKQVKEFKEMINRKQQLMIRRNWKKIIDKEVIMLTLLYYILYAFFEDVLLRISAFPRMF